MAIDTEDRRRSVLGNTILPMAVYPIPDSSISKDDRRHATALYRGINTVLSNFFRWIPEQDSGSNYSCEQDTSSVYGCEQDSSISSSIEQDSSITQKEEQDSSIECQDQRDIDED